MNGKIRKIGVRKMAIGYLLFIAVFSAGALFAALKIWPYPLVERAINMFRTNEYTGLSLSQKISNDFGDKPYRMLAEFGGGHDGQAIEGLPLKERRGPLTFWRGANAPDGYIYLYGVFDFEDSLHGAVLLDTNGKAVHRWPMREAAPGLHVKPQQQKVAHGSAFLPDGSIIGAYDFGDTLQRVDACGERSWIRSGRFHHAVTPYGNAVWALEYVDAATPLEQEAIQKIDAKTGETLKLFTLKDIEAANPGLDLFGVRQIDQFEKSGWAHDPVHVNDADPLPARLAAAFPQFEAEDLLVSVRNLNLLFVVDPDDLKVKWWRTGSWRRQHDPDWLADGRIAVFDNAMHRSFSRIVAIDPKTNDAEVLVDGENFNFYSRIRGKIQMSNAGLVVSSAQQGRVFIVDGDNGMTVEIVNEFDASKNEMLLLTEGEFYTKGEIDPSQWRSCQ